MKNSRTRLSLIVLIITGLLLLPGKGHTNASKTVIARGAGPTRDAALKEAWRQAVENNVGGYITSETLVQNHQLIEDKILAYSSGYIEDFDILREGFREGEYWIQIRAKVKNGLLLSTLKRHKINIKGESLYASLVTNKQAKKNRAHVCRQELQNWRYPGDYATVQFSKIEVLPDTKIDYVSYFRRNMEVATVRARGIEVKVKEERIGALAGWITEAYDTKNPDILLVIERLYGPRYPRERNSLYAPHPPSPNWSPFVVLRCYDKAGELLYESGAWYGYARVSKRQGLMEDTNISSHSYLVPVHVLRKTAQVMAVVAP